MLEPKGITGFLWRVVGSTGPVLCASKSSQRKWNWNRGSGFEYV